MLDNRITVNQNKLEMITKLAKRSMDMLVNGDKNDLLSKPNNGSNLKSFNSDLDDIIVVKLRNKFGL